ncbi:MAG: hypothetical protein Q8P25_01155 [Candidatus Curtissbacteria bacterium]|nr:hypothetical protein [Candidatus Curtissbacteria bacterium]
MPKLVDSLQFTVYRKKHSVYRLPSTVYHSGYTLIEFLVVLGLLVLAVGSTLVFLTSILRGSNQANISAEVKQNGQAVLDSLERQIREAKSATRITSSLPPGVSDELYLVLSDGSNLYIGCLNSVSGPTVLNAAIGTKAGSAPSSASDFQTMTNRDSVSGVSISDCQLAATTGSTSNGDVVTISFTAGRAISAPTRVDFDASAKFNTTISLRKY